jgi:hypothetical protein
MIHHSLVYPLIVTTNQDQLVKVLGQSPQQSLIHRFPLRAEKNDLPSGQPGERLNRCKDGIRLEQHPHPAPIGFIIHPMVLIGGKLPRIG